MVMLQYPAVTAKDDNGSVLVTFPDFDDAVTCGERAKRHYRMPWTLWKPLSSPA